MTSAFFNHHPCAVCDTPVGHDFLMCGPHWKLVPPGEQLALYRAWGALRRLHGTGKRAPRQLLEDFLAAKDAATESARSALATTIERGTA